MANNHYGNIGDIWKHLPLAEIIAVEAPTSYWESHAGSALYPLTHSAERDYGVYGFIDEARQSRLLAESRFYRLLQALAGDRDYPSVYPGSPAIAMNMLQARADYIFCDIDGRSLADIDQRRGEAGIPGGRVRLAEADGVLTVLDAAKGLTAERARRTLVVIDPCAGDEPFAASECRPSPMDLFARLAKLGARTILWYAFDSLSHRQVCRERIRASLRAQAAGSRGLPIWCGEIWLRGLGDAGAAMNPGVRGCGILCSGLSDEALRASASLGSELARSYQKMLLPDGTSGALEFVSFDPLAG